MVDKLGKRDAGKTFLSTMLAVSCLTSSSTKLLAKVRVVFGNRTRSGIWCFCCFCVLIFSLTTKNDPLFYLLTQLPLVFSASYTDYELHVNAAYSARVNVELMKVGLRGTSLFMASGDYGIGTQYVKGESSIRVDVDTA